MTQVLTPTGYRDAYSLQFGDEVCAFDMVSGEAIINTLESKPQWVDATEWARWWSVEDEVPPFRFFRVNGEWVLNSEQSIWRNGVDVCHAKHLVVGDVIYDDEDNDVLIESIEEVTNHGWWRFDVSGDHSYIIDGLTVHNASRFWVLGTGDMDGSTTTHIAATSNGSGGASYPGSADTLTLDGNSGGGTVTSTASHTMQALTMGAYTGTWDNSVNNNNYTLSGAGLSLTGTATRTVRLGSATYTLTGPNGGCLIQTVTNLTLTQGTSTILFTGNNARDLRLGSGATLATVTIDPSSSGMVTVNVGGTITTLNVNAPNFLVWTSGTTPTITNAIAWVGTPSSPIGLAATTANLQVQISFASGSTIEWASVRDVVGSPSGRLTCNNSLNVGGNSGITVNAPSASGGTAGVIGS